MALLSSEKRAQGKLSSPGRNRPVGAKPSEAQALSTLRSGFEENRGQFGSGIDFVGRTDGYSLGLTAGSAIISFKGKSGPEAEVTESSQITIKLIGSNKAAGLAASAKQPGVINYFRGDDSDSWITGVRRYDRLKYRGVYPGTDLVYRRQNGRLKYEFLVAPGASVEKIRFQFEGLDELRITRAGHLLMAKGDKRLVHERPYIYQDTSTGRRRVDGGFRIRGAGEVGFWVRGADPAKPLVIDPVLVYSTYLGGLDESHNDIATGIALRPGPATENAAYIAGYTNDPNFPGDPKAEHAGNYDAFVAKLRPTGEESHDLIWAAFLGGNNDDKAASIAVAEDETVYIAGRTESDSFPGLPAGVQPSGDDKDAFIAKLSDGDGSIQANLIGGSDVQSGTGIAVGPGGQVVMSGSSRDGIPTAFVAKFDSALSLVARRTFLGSNQPAPGMLGNNVEGRAIAVDPKGSIYVSGIGVPEDDDFPPKQAFGPGKEPPSLNRMFLVKLNQSLDITYAATLNGTGLPELDDGTFHSGNLVAVDSDENAYLTGSTADAIPDNFPATQNNAYQKRPIQSPRIRDAFLAKLDTKDPSESSLRYATYLGGIDRDDGSGVATWQAPSGKTYVYLTGFTQSDNFPFKNGLQAAPGGAGQGEDPFLAMFDLDASGEESLVFSTYFGGDGPGTDKTREDMATAVAAASDGRAFISGFTRSDVFTVTERAFKTFRSLEDPTFGPPDAFMTVLDPMIISRIEPPGGVTCGGEEVRIHGRFLPSAPKVRFGDKDALNVVAQSDELIVATTPASPVGPVPVNVFGPAGEPPRQINPPAGAPPQVNLFTFASPLPGSLSSLVPNRGSTSGGDRVTITGSFACVGAVKFGGIPAPIEAQKLSNTGPDQLIVQTPAREPGTVTVTVETADGLSSLPAAPGADQFTYVAGSVPQIPDGGGGGTATVNLDPGGTTGTTTAPPANSQTPGGNSVQSTRGGAPPGTGGPGALSAGPAPAGPVLTAAPFSSAFPVAATGVVGEMGPAAVTAAAASPDQQEQALAAPRHSMSAFQTTAPAAGPAVLALSLAFWCSMASFRPGGLQQQRSKPVASPAWS